ncbi:hypothetical protein BCV70DRAFT_90483 [Testicularia cyperi]|uniref:Uncharacterized protein n=1 Tax=Testicularia cyperi TaxID=1882483 RepID=A0A317XV01_9BASI|nr:hypothetical protein BCV70DRAFT_90483 [Testicularia cyperi]
MLAISSEWPKSTFTPGSGPSLEKSSTKRPRHHTPVLMWEPYSASPITSYSSTSGPARTPWKGCGRPPKLAQGSCRFCTAQGAPIRHPKAHLTSSARQTRSNLCSSRLGVVSGGTGDLSVCWQESSAPGSRNLAPEPTSSTSSCNKGACATDSKSWTSASNARGSASSSAQTQVGGSRTGTRSDSGDRGRVQDSSGALAERAHEEFGRGPPQISVPQSKRPENSIQRLVQSSLISSWSCPASHRL